MAESFREFFTRRNGGMPYPTRGGETALAVFERIGETIADWMDELAKRAGDQK